MTKVAEKKIRKRKWYEILSKDFNNVLLGETITKDPNLIIKRILKVNLNTLNNDVKSQNIEILFRINEFKDDKFQTYIYGYNLNPSYIKRVIKTSKTKIDDSFICTSKDNIKLRIKPILITKNNTTNSIATLLLNKNRQLFTEFLSKKTYIEFFNDLITKKVTPEFKKNLHKVYPISFLEVRMMRRLE